MPIVNVLCFILGCFFTALVFRGDPSSSLKNNLPVISVGASVISAIAIFIQCKIINSQKGIMKQQAEISRDGLKIAGQANEISKEVALLPTKEKLLQKCIASGDELIKIIEAEGETLRDTTNFRVSGVYKAVQFSLCLEEFSDFIGKDNLKEKLNIDEDIQDIINFIEKYSDITVPPENNVVEQLERINHKTFPLRIIKDKQTEIKKAFKESLWL